MNPEEPNASEQTSREEIKTLSEKLSRTETELKAAAEASQKAASDLAALNDKYLRVMAEYDNYRRRTSKEKDEITSYAFSPAALGFLPLADNFERALGFAPDDENLLVLYKQLTEIFGKMDIRAFESDGEKFDPNLHNAVMHEEDPEAGENVVVQTFVRGYKIGDKVLRHAMVKVAN